MEDYLSKEPLGKWISILYRYSMIHANEKLKPFNMTASQLMFFIFTVDNAGITQEKLSYMLKINKSTTAKAIKVLEKNGYITRTVSEKDRRSYNLYPTPKAIEVRKQIRKLALEWDDILCRGLTKDDKEKIYEILKTMAKNAEDYIINQRRNTHERNKG
ncbi:MarR family winged helix-turn-helix transcriptional regulator [Hippea sp. KM1]|uniref:MarR family winged helix-turn-helix transcriptional regulator n=1 Tax=Hippea sp. KM1 TaxID=944481 RepID=UPI0004BCD7CD|nr:MarR family transcriptional regulator [Hippea sp. KM1]